MFRSKGQGQDHRRFSKRYFSKHSKRYFSHVKLTHLHTRNISAEFHHASVTEYRILSANGAEKYFKITLGMAMANTSELCGTMERRYLSYSPCVRVNS